VTGKRRRRRIPSLVAADPARPAFEVLGTAGATTLANLVVQGGLPAVRLGGVGHLLQNLQLRGGGGIQADGGGHTLAGVTVTRASGPCVVIGAASTAVTRTIVRRCRGDGIVVTGAGSSLAQNLVAGSRGAGIRVAGGSNSLVRNRVVGNRQGGLLVDGRGNTLLGNRAAGNRRGAIVAAACNINAGRNRPKPRMPACVPGAAPLLATAPPVS
jgi:parallel beta-helix repeat protein